MGNLKTRNTWFVKADKSQDSSIDAFKNNNQCTQPPWSQVVTPEEPSDSPPVQLRRSNRNIRPPSHLLDYVRE